MPKHTPGPWEIDRGFRDAFNHSSGHYTIDDDFLTVYMGAEDIDDTSTNVAEVHGPNQEANAQLLYAAPDLLKAAKAGAKWMRWWLDQNECDCPPEGHICGYLDRKWELEKIEQAIILAERKEE